MAVTVLLSSSAYLSRSENEKKTQIYNELHCSHLEWYLPATFPLLQCASEWLQPQDIVCKGNCLVFICFEFYYEGLSRISKTLLFAYNFGFSFSFICFCLEHNE